MFIDYVSLLLINTMIGYFLLAGYVYSGLDDRDQTKWAVGFSMAGAVSLIFGGVMAVTWPLPGPYSMVFGEMSVLLGIVFLGAGLAMARGWSPLVVAIYAFFAGGAAVLIGIQIMLLKLTLAPTLSGLGFVLSGLAGLFAAPLWAFFRGNRPVRAIAAVALCATALIWAVIVCQAYWSHMQRLGKWVPPAMRASASHP